MEGGGEREGGDEEGLQGFEGRDATKRKPLD